MEEKYGINEFLDVEIQYTDKREQNDDELTKVSVFDQSNLNVENEIKKENEDENGENKETNITNDIINQTDNINKEVNNGIKETDDLKKDDEDEIKGESKDESKDESKTSINEDNELKEESDIEEQVDEKKEKKPKREKKDPVPKNWLFRGARLLFKEPNVLVNQFNESDLKFKDIDEEGKCIDLNRLKITNVFFYKGLLKFLCEENGFNEDRVKPAINRVKQSKGKTNQSRIDSFFKAIPQNDKGKANKNTATNSKKRLSTDSSSSKNKRWKKK